MTDLSDINMDGVKPSGEPQGLPQGTYLVRIEDTEKKTTKDKFYEDGKPHEENGRNFYLQMLLKVYGGPNDGHGEFIRLNLWNSNPTAVNMAKSELKAIQEATGVASTNSNDFHNKWMVLEITPGIKDKTKLYNKFSQVPAGLLSTYAHVPPVPPKDAAAAQAQAMQQQPQQAATVNTGTAQAAQPAQAQQGQAAAAGAVPSWAAKK